MVTPVHEGDSPAVPYLSPDDASFSLVGAPWIPLLTTSGMECRGLAGAFGDDVITVATGDDLEDAAITRLLLAVQIAADGSGLRPPDWLDSHEAEFNLFDQQRPFWQNRDMARFVEVKGAVRPLLSASYRYAGRGSTAVNPWHNECGLVLDAAAAARLVVVRQQFSVGGKQPFAATAFGNRPMSATTSVATNRPFLWLDDGRLASSLILTAALAGSRARGRFWFTWPDGAQPGEPGIPTGVLDALTWQSRSILLIPGTADVCPGIMICDGVRWPDARQADSGHDLELVPHTVYAPSGDTATYLAQRVHPDRAAWHQLAVMCTDPAHPVPRVNRDGPPGSVLPRWRLSGLSAFQAAIAGTVSASFPIPVDPTALGLVIAEMGRARRRLAGVDASLAAAVSSTVERRPALVRRPNLQSEFETIAVDVATGDLSPENAIGLVEGIVVSATAQAYAHVARVRPLAAARVAARRAS